MVPVLITSVIEINVGIIVGCMPQLTSGFRNQLVKSFHFLSLASFRNRLFSSRKPSNGAEDSDNQFQRVSSRQSTESPYLETKLLGSINGKGKFLRSGLFRQKGWLKSSILGSRDERESVMMSNYRDGTMMGRKDETEVTVEGRVLPEPATRQEWV